MITKQQFLDFWVEKSRLEPDVEILLDRLIYAHLKASSSVRGLAADPKISHYSGKEYELRDDGHQIAVTWETYYCGDVDYQLIIYPLDYLFEEDAYSKIYQLLLEEEEKKKREEEQREKDRKSKRLEERRKLYEELRIEFEVTTMPSEAQ